MVFVQKTNSGEKTDEEGDSKDSADVEEDNTKSEGDVQVSLSSTVATFSSYLPLTSLVEERESLLTGVVRKEKCYSIPAIFVPHIARK